MRNAVTRNGDTERGYVLLSMLLFIACMAIALTALAPSIAFEIRRDQEEELVHRGVQYTRAIRRYAKATGRYPARTEDLLGDNGQRYLRKLYKDPITRGDFKLLHLGDIQVPATKLDASGSVAASDSTSNTQAQNSAATNTSATGLVQNNASAPQQPVYGDNTPGLLIFGVASKSRAKTIREFFGKNHYNDWLFFYDARNDRGLDIKGPTSLTPPAPPIQAQTAQAQPAGPLPNSTQESAP